MFIAFLIICFLFRTYDTVLGRVQNMKVQFYMKIQKYLLTNFCLHLCVTLTNLKVRIVNIL